MQSSLQYPLIGCRSVVAQVGVYLSKDLMTIAGHSLKANITTLGPLVLPFSEQILFLANIVSRKVSLYSPLNPLSLYYALGAIPFYLQTAIIHDDHMSGRLLLLIGHHPGFSRILRSPS